MTQPRKEALELIHSPGRGGWYFEDFSGEDTRQSMLYATESQANKAYDTQSICWGAECPKCGKSCVCNFR